MVCPGAEYALYWSGSGADIHVILGGLIFMLGGFRAGV